MSDVIENPADISAQPIPDVGNLASQPKVPSELLENLRRIRREEPTAEQLADWARNLRQAAHQVMEHGSQSPEANQALQQVELAQELNRLVKQLTDQEQKTTQAQRMRNLRGVYDAITKFTSLVNQLCEDRFSAKFPWLIGSLIEQAESDKQDAESIKVELLADVKIQAYVTSKAMEMHEEALEGLYELERERGSSGVYVPASKDSEDLIPLSTAIENQRAKLIKFCEEKAGQRLIKARQELGNDTDQGLLDAHIECQEGLKVLQAQRIQKVLENEKVAKDLKLLANQIQSQLEDRQKTLEFLESVYELDPLDALEQLSRLSYQKHPEVRATREILEQKFKRTWQQKVFQAMGSAEACRLNRRYSGGKETAFYYLSECTAELKAVPKEFEALIADVGKTLDEASESIKKEEEEWKVYCEFQNDIKDKISKGIVDARVLSDIEEAESGAWGTLFATELKSLKILVTRQAGDQLILEKARQLYARNPADSEIDRLLGSDATGKKAVGPSSKLFAKAEEILFLHYSYASLENARSAFKNFDLLNTQPEQWAQAVERELRNCTVNTQNVPSEKTENLQHSSAQLQIALQEVQNVHVKVADFTRSKKFIEASQTLESKLTNLDAASDTAFGLRSLLKHVRQLWRSDRMKYVHEYILNKEPSLAVLVVAAQYINELDQHQALDQDGDDQIATQIRSKWHLHEIQDILGFTLGTLDETPITELGKKTGVNWADLLGHLDGLLNSRYGNDGSVQRQAYRLRLIALSNYGLSVERKESIDRLTGELTRLTAGGEAAGVFVALALRHLEQPGGYKKARELISQLKNVNQKTQQVATGLEKLIEAHQLREQQQLPMAVASLQSGVLLLTNLLPEIQIALSKEIEQTTHQWYLDLANTILQKLIPKADLIQHRNLCSLEDYIDILEQLIKVTPHLPQEPRIAQIVQTLSQHNTSVGEEFYEEVSSLKNNYWEDLTEKVKESRKHMQFFEIAFAKDSPVKQDIHQDPWQSLSQIRENFPDQKKVWEDALISIDDIRNTLQVLLGEDKVLWAWNTEPKENPNKDLRLSRDKLFHTLYTLGAYQPREVKDLETFISAFQQTVTAVTKEFENLLDLVREEKYGAALEKLKDVEIVTESWEITLNKQVVPALGSKAIVIRLNPHFVLPNPYRSTTRNEDGEWLETGNLEDIRGLDKIGLHIEKLMDSCEFWEEWVRRTTVDLQQLRKARRDARDYLTKRHHLGEAINICHETIDRPLEPEPKDQERRNIILLRIYDLTEKSSRLIRDAEPPRCFAAHRFAKPPEEIAPPTNAAASALKLWKDLSSTNRVRIIAAWRKYLSQEIAVSLQDLGPSVKPETNPYDLPEAWAGIWNKDIENAFKTLDQPKDQSLEDLISQKLARLNELLEQITAHNRRYKLPKNISSRSQEILKDLLTEAMAIDDQAPVIIGAHEIYKRNEQRMKS